MPHAPSGFITEPVPHQDAADYIRGKAVVVGKDIFGGLLPELRARAITIAGVECADTIQRCRDAIATLPAGGDWKKIKKELANEISPWLVDPNADDETRGKQTRAAKARAELLIRIHGGQAYAATNARVLDDNLDIFPFRQYLSMEDSRVRSSHAALNKKILPADSPWWHKHTPPWEFGCRCTVAGISAEEAGEIAAGESGKPPEARTVLEGAHLHELEHNNRLVSGPNQIHDTRTGYEKTGQGYEWDHRSMQMPLDMIKARYDPPVWDAFAAWASKQEIPGMEMADGDGWKIPRLMDALNGIKIQRAVAKGHVLPVGALPSAALRIQKGIATVVATAAKDVGAVLDKLHGASGMLPVSVDDVTDGTKVLGEFVPLKGAGWRMGVRAGSGIERYVLAHEYGHAVHAFQMHDGPGKDAFDAIIRAAKETPSYKELAAVKDRTRREYLQSDQEIFARSYAQWVATKSGDRDLLAELAIARQKDGKKVWPDTEFASIRPWFDAHFQQQ